jgi:fructose-bisphosphate aldolase class II
VAHACGVSVEAEIGHVGGSEGNTNKNTAKEDLYTIPEDAVRFAKETNIDALAIAFGTVHGVYKGEPKLDFERLKKIRSMVDIPLVMHGGSGLVDSDFKMAIECGISKINFFTGMSRYVIKEMRTLIDESDGKVRHIKLWDTQLQATIDCVKKQLDLFGTESIYK